MGKASRRKHAAEQQRLYFDIQGDARSDADRAKARAMLDALQRKLVDDAQREDGFYFVDGKYVDARRPRFTPGMKTQTLAGHVRRITHVALAPMESSASTDDLNSFVVTFGTDSICVWNMKTGERLGNLDIASRCAVSICGAASRPSMGPMLWIGYATHLQPTVVLFDLNTMQFQSQQVTDTLWNFGIGHQQQITCMAFSHATNPLLATGSFDSTCIIWSVSASEPTPILTMRLILPVADAGVSTCAFAYDDQQVMTVGSDGTIKVWEVNNDRIPDGLHQEHAQWQRATPYTLAISHTRSMLLFDDIPAVFHGHDEWLLYIHRDCLRKTDVLNVPPFTPVSGQDISIASDPSKEAGEHANPPSNANEMIEKPSTDNRTTEETISEVEKLRREYEKMDSFDFQMMLNPAAPVLHGDASGMTTTRWPVLSPDAHGRLLRTFTRRKEKRDYAAHTSHATDCAVAKEVDLVVTVSFDKSVICWSFSKGIVLAITREAHTASITCCALTSPTTSPDLELLLATSGKDNLVKVWRFNSLETCTLECVYSLAGHYDAITSLAFDSSGVFLLSVGDDTLGHCWRVRPAPPDAPSKPTVVAVDRFAIAIEWKVPLANGAALLKYVIKTEQLSTLTHDGSDMKPVKDSDVDVKYKTWTVDMLQPGIQYRLSVAAVNSVGQSRWSEPTEVVETLAYAPSKIYKAVQYRDISATNLRLAWKAPCANGAVITSYIVKALPENTLFVPVMETKVPTDELLVVTAEPEGPKRRHPVKSKAKKPVTKPLDTSYEYILHGLWPGEVYQFIAAAENRCGVGDFSPFSDYIKMESTAPDAPEKPQLTNINKRDAEVAWVKPRSNGSEILQYIIEWTQDEDDTTTTRTSVTLLTKSIEGTTYPIMGLRPGRPLRVWVAATNLVNGKLTASPFSEPSDLVYTVSDVPDKPPKLMIEAPTAHSVVVAVLPPCDNGDPIDRYRLTLCFEEVQFGIATKKVVRDFELDVTDFDGSVDSVLRFTMLKLRAKAFYSATVAAHNALGWSIVSDSSVVVSTKPPTVPATIAIAPEIRDIEPTQATISWTKPVHDGGAPLASIVLQYSVNDGPFEHEIVLFQGSELVLEQLKPRATYAFRVAATNSAGRAEFSPACAPFTTPSLVDYTITNYFAYRPQLEHDKASVLQRRYKLWKRRIHERRVHLEQLTQILASSWHIL